SRQAHRFSSPLLKKVVCVYLFAIGVWMVLEALAHAENVLLDPTGLVRWVLAAVVGFVIAGLSGVLGVAGGEMRIPALIYLFALPVKEAGTISLLVSVPTVAAGAFTYRRLGHIPNRVLVVALVMGLGSILGVLVGAALLPLVDKHTVKALLGVILLLATACLSLPGLFNGKRTH
ncbi:MAG: sulfite exporter TauE/SafE family protein, partial [Gemmataceae bacterium]|nr:sulfite exporter TauE/SafE family protein [Gemmataceae bacterium]